MSFSKTIETDYVYLSTYGAVPIDFVPMNGARSVVPRSGNIIDDLLYFFKFHDILKPFVINRSQAKITLLKNDRELIIDIYSYGDEGSVSLSGDQTLIENVEFHINRDQFNLKHELNDLVNLLYSFRNIFYSYA